MLTLIVDHRGIPWASWTTYRSWSCRSAIAGPSCARTLAFHGATVMKVESRDHPDVARLFGSAWAAGAGPEVVMDTTPYLGEMGANKRSVGLDLKQPEGRRAALALLAAADVFITNYTTPAVRDLGLAYEEVVAVEPADRLPGATRVRLRARPPVLRVPGVGTEPGPPRRPGRTHRLPGPAAGRHRHRRPSRLLRGTARRGRGPDRTGAPGPHGRGQPRRHLSVRDHRVGARAVPAGQRPHRPGSRAQRQPAAVARSARLLPVPGPRQRGWPSPWPATTSGRRWRCW